MATISDVARRAGVGVGTVSRVINNSPLVSDATRQKVLKAMEELDYVPNPFARRLSLGRTLTLAVIVPFFTRPSFVERLRGVEAAIAETEYDLIVHNVETVAKRNVYFRSVPRPERVDGLLIISLSPSDEDVARFHRAGVPTVLVDARHPRLPRVVVDDVAGGRTATRHLIDLGHHRIAFLGDQYPNPFSFTSSHERYAGYRNALEEAGLPVRPEYTATGEHGRDVARELTHRLLSLPEPPTAIVAASDTQALGVLEVAQERGIPVPESLSVIGYDDIEIAEYLHLTTIRQPLFDSGWRGTHLLLRAIENGEGEPSCDLLPIELVVRATTAPPAE
ncbi:MAG TPA: LacI family transcriptional regulator [Anaerolineales bacterium]|nr:LacI family transcriptional regulator [Anaerolineae bacterium]HIQ02131.1 LacI family transcriptional regulator [Anaerolineales bacterium]